MVDASPLFLSFQYILKIRPFTDCCVIAALQSAAVSTRNKLLPAVLWGIQQDVFVCWKSP